MWVCALAALAPVVASGQELRGRVLDAEADRAVPMAVVTLLDRSDLAVQSVLADSSGWFHIRLPSAGRYHVRVEAFGYALIESRPLDFRLGDRLEVELRVAVSPVAIPPMRVVSARRIDERLERHGYYERQIQLEATGVYFLDVEEIRSRHRFSLEAVMRSLPGVRVGGTGGRTVGITNRRGQAFFVCLDGMNIGFPDVGLDAIVPLSTILAIEVYPNRSYLGRAKCPLMIWTGNPDDPPGQN